MKRILFILRWLGRHKFFAQRVRDYLVVAQLAMVADIWLEAHGYIWKGILSVSIPLFALLYIVDKWRVPGRGRCRGHRDGLAQRPQCKTGQDQTKA